MNEEFDLNELQYNFDFKGFLLKLFSYWKLFLLCLGITFSIAYYINVRKVPVYTMSNLISIKDDQNPFFSTNTSLTFNWGGTTDKLNTAVISLRSRSHNEKVVDRLQYYINYYRDGKYKRVDAYKQSPFKIVVDTSRYQIIGSAITIRLVDSLKYTLEATFEKRNYGLQSFGSKKKSQWFADTESFKREFSFDEPVRLPFFNGVIERDKDQGLSKQPYYISFTSFNSAVSRQLRILINPESNGSSVLRLQLSGTNKARLVDYLNTSVQVLSDDVLERKNIFATKTIRFIDSSLAYKSKELKGAENELNDYKNKNAIFDLEKEGAEISAKLNKLDSRKESVNRELNYYNTLEDYLLTRTNYNDVPAPSVAGISEASIVSGVSRIFILAEERSKYQYSVKEGNSVFDDIDRQINAVKSVLLENIISSKSLINSELKDINANIYKNEALIRKLPREQQELLKIQRRYDVSQGTYNLFLAKRNEAGLVKAANVSDVFVIDPAKDTGGGQIGPNTQLNYVVALIIGLLIPFIIVFIVFILDNKIHTATDVTRLSHIPLLGTIGKSTVEGNLAVLGRPKSTISESFRALRSSLQFIYKKQGISGAKTVLITSSISGEGKTFCAINIASVFALSNKKTILLGLDLRKPKIFGDFNIDNTIGVVNYLINDATKEEIIQKTSIPDLDIITSGPIPPNPSELLMNDQMEELMTSLKQEYDYIILDTPPIGLVADVLELIKYADANIYVIRQNFTQKGMLSVINEKYKTGEVKNISFVFNFFKQKKGYGYGYGYGSYADSYHETAEDKTKGKLWKKLFK